MTLSLLKTLIQCESFTPNDAGCIDYIESILTPMGFRCHYFNKEDTKNFYAEIGTGPDNFCFAGHTDVVPVGDASTWIYPPFSAHVHDGKIYGRGTSDMKGAIAAFVSALSGLKKMPTDKRLSILLTSDEEGPATYGIQYVLPILEEKKLLPTLCLVGEPTHPETAMGKFIKIGRRGSFNAKVTIQGRMGHVAYQDAALNPHPPLAQLMTTLQSHIFDQGTEHFSPTNLEITNVHSFNTATNVIPQNTELSFNIRFNDLYNKNTLEDYLQKTLSALKMDYPSHQFTYTISCDSLAEYCSDKFLIETIEKATKSVIDIMPICTTDGATSDARFIQKYCPVIEFGLFTNQAHQINEHISLESLSQLTEIYTHILENIINH
jgi:succinyl-diaminopimelate desuccinylase